MAVTPFDSWILSEETTEETCNRQAPSSTYSRNLNRTRQERHGHSSWQPKQRSTTSRSCLSLDVEICASQPVSLECRRAFTVTVTVPVVREARALDLSWTVSERRGEREFKVNLKTAEIKIGKVPVVMTCRHTFHERAGTAFAVRPERWVTGNYFVTAGQK